MCVKMLLCLPPTTLGDASCLDAARRLKRALPSRKHLLIGGDTEHPKRNRRRSVMVQGVRYPSMRKAARAHNVAGSIMLGWIASGRAEYAED